MRIKTSKLLYYFIILSFVLLLFQSPLSRSFLPTFLRNVINNYDELFAGICLLFLANHVFSVGVPKKYVQECLVLVLFVLVGFIGTSVHELQTISAVVEDVTNCAKFMICLLGLKFICKRYHSELVLMKLTRISEYLIYIFFVLTVVDWFLPNLLFINESFRYGIHEVHLFYYHSAVLAQVVVLLISLVSLKNDNSRYTTLQIIMCLAILASTLRSKAFGFIFFYLFVCGYEKLKVGRGKILLVILGTLTIAFVSSNNIEKYYGNETTARAILTRDSIEIAIDNAPIGLGYGTFGSASAAKYYSSVYEKLGYTSRYGMGYKTTNYLTDSFWPVLFGEFGFLGVAFYSYIIILLLKKCLKAFKYSKQIGIMLISLMGYFLISSTAATAFFNPISVPNAILIALGFNCCENIERGMGEFGNED